MRRERIEALQIEARKIVTAFVETWPDLGYDGDRPLTLDEAVNKFLEDDDEGHELFDFEGHGDPLLTAAVKFLAARGLWFGAQKPPVPLSKDHTYNVVLLERLADESHGREVRAQYQASEYKAWGAIEAFLEAKHTRKMAEV